MCEELSCIFYMMGVAYVTQVLPFHYEPLHELFYQPTDVPLTAETRHLSIATPALTIVRLMLLGVGFIFVFPRLQSKIAAEALARAE